VLVLADNLVGLLERGVGPSQITYLHITAQVREIRTYIHTSTCKMCGYYVPGINLLQAYLFVYS